MDELVQGDDILREGQADGDTEEQPLEVVVVTGRDTEIKAIVEPDLPGEAYALLFELDPNGLSAGPLRFDRSAGFWRQPTIYERGYRRHPHARH